MVIFFQEEEEVEQKQVQTEFTVKLMAFDEKQKVPLIKEVKNLMSDMNLVQVLNHKSLKIIKIIKMIVLLYKNYLV